MLDVVTGHVEPFLIPAQARFYAFTVQQGEQPFGIVTPGGVSERKPAAETWIDLDQDWAARRQKGL